MVGLLIMCYLMSIVWTCLNPSATSVGYTICAGGGCEVSIVTRVRAAWLREVQGVFTLIDEQEIVSPHPW